MFIDVHCHLDICNDIGRLIERARTRGVGIIITNGIDVKTNRKALEFSEKYPEVRAALGLYPPDAKMMSGKLIDSEIEFIRQNKGRIVCIGEVGLDLKEDSSLDRQVEIFERFIDLALELNLPITVHSRKAEKEAIEILEKKGAKKVLMHCFSGNMKLVKRIADNGWFLSIPTNIVFSEHFQEVVKKTDLKNLLCETDSPFLHPFKEKNNEPALVIESYKKIAEIKGLKLKDVEKRIEENYSRLFV